MSEGNFHLVKALKRAYLYLTLSVGVCVSLIVALVLMLMGTFPALALEHAVEAATTVAEPGLAENIGAIVGVSGGTLAIILVLGRQALELAGKWIPDSSTGVLGIIRDLAKFFAGYKGNRT